MRSLLAKLFILFLVVGITNCGGNASTENSENSTSTTTTVANQSSKKENIKKKKKILFFGDSLTAGYGLKDPSESYVGVIQNILDSLEMDYQTVNAGVSGETSSGGNDRIDWILDQNTIDVFILELGANDGLRGIQSDETTKNLQSIIDKVKAKFPEAKLLVAGMLAPPNMGTEFTEKFAAIFPNLAKENEAALVPFLLDSVAGIPNLNQRDGIHPTTEGHKILAENVWRVLKGVL